MKCDIVIPQLDVYNLELFLETFWMCSVSLFSHPTNRILRQVSTILAVQLSCIIHFVIQCLI